MRLLAACGAQYNFDGRAAVEAAIARPSEFNMRVLPLVRSMVGAITVIAGASLLSGPILKVKRDAIDALNPDIPSASQPYLPKTLSNPSDANDWLIPLRDRPGSDPSNELGSAAGEAHATAATASSDSPGVRASESAEIAGLAPPAPQATFHSAGRPTHRAENDQGEAKSAPASGDSSQSVEPASGERSSSGSLVVDGTSTDADSTKEAPTTASLLLPMGSLSVPQFLGEEEAGPSASIADESRPAVLPSRLPPMPDYGDGVTADEAPGSGALPTTSSPSEASTFSTVAAPEPAEVSNGGSFRPSRLTKSLQSLSGSAPFPLDNAPRKPPSSATIVPAGHSESTAGRPVLKNGRRSPPPFVTKENITRALAFDRLHHRPKLVASRHAPAMVAEGTFYGRAAIPPAFAGGKLASWMTRTESTDETRGMSWSVALRRRCPSIVASADEYDDDLVRLCRLSVGL